MRVTLKLLLMSAVAWLIAGCATAMPKADVCGPWKPIYVSADDVLTDGTAKQISNHDETGARLCGWEPTTPTKAKH